MNRHRRRTFGPIQLRSVRDLTKALAPNAGSHATYSVRYPVNSNVGNDSQGRASARAGVSCKQVSEQGTGSNAPRKGCHFAAVYSKTNPTVFKGRMKAQQHAGIISWPVLQQLVHSMPSRHPKKVSRTLTPTCYQLMWPHAKAGVQVSCSKSGSTSIRRCARRRFCLLCHLVHIASPVLCKKPKVRHTAWKFRQGCTR